MGILLLLSVVPSLCDRSISPDPSFLLSINHTQKMVLDINLFRKEKGGDPELIKESQRRRFKPVEIVDEITALDEEWRKLQFQVDEVKKAQRNLSKEIGALYKAKKTEEADAMKPKMAEGVAVPKVLQPYLGGPRVHSL